MKVFVSPNLKKYVGKKKVAQDAAAVQVPEFSDIKNEVASKENLQLTPPDLQHFNAIDDYDIYYDEWTPILSWFLFRNKFLLFH